MKVCIIGGTGRMGRFFGNILERAGHDLARTGRGPDEKYRECAAEADVVMISVPIRQTVRVIATVAGVLSPDQLVCDLTSLKTAPVGAMLESGADVLGLHPMFGPSAPSLSGQTIIAVRARTRGPLTDNLLGIFRENGARITYSTAEEHDRMMAVVQGLTHFLTLTLAETMRTVGIPPEKTLDFMSPVYQIEMGLAGRLLSQDPALYEDILRLNPYVPDVLRTCEDSVRRLGRSVSDKEGVFSDCFRRDAEFFGDYCRDAASLTDRLIASMVNP
jgi:prephenate dehydrogenase